MFDFDKISGKGSSSTDTKVLVRSVTKSGALGIQLQLLGKQLAVLQHEQEKLEAMSRQREEQIRIIKKESEHLEKRMKTELAKENIVEKIMETVVQENLDLCRISQDFSLLFKIPQVKSFLGKRKHTNGLQSMNESMKSKKVRTTRSSRRTELCQREVKLEKID